MLDKLIFHLNRIKEQLWIKPMFYVVFSIIVVFLTKLVDYTRLDKIVPNINPGSIEIMLSTLTASMLVISTFAVASMVSAYATASSNATPRSFSLIISDDVSQSALSSFIGAFIFSITALVTLKNSFYEKAGYFTLFLVTILVFAFVIYTFLRWMDQIARLGRLGPTIERVEQAATNALCKRAKEPRLGGATITPLQADDIPIFSNSVGHVQYIDMNKLQKFAEQESIEILINSLPGAYVVPNRPLVYLRFDNKPVTTIERESITNAFLIGQDRIFDDDPRFGIIVLSEIAGRALSTSVNDPGTAIGIIGNLVRLFVEWSFLSQSEIAPNVEFTRVQVPEILTIDMLDDAFTSIARDGAETIEVVIKLHKSFETLSNMENKELALAAIQHGKTSLLRSKEALTISSDIDLLNNITAYLKVK